MTTTTQGKETTGVDVEKLLELEHVDIHKALGIPPVPPTGEGARVRPWRRLVAVGVLAGVAGLAAGYGAAAWSYGQDISALERQASLTTSVPFGGFQSEYSAAREHLVLAQAMAPEVLPPFTQAYSAVREHQALADSMAAGTLAGYGTEYSAPREHLALSDNLAAGGAQGSWADAPGGARTFLMYQDAEA